MSVFMAFCLLDMFTIYWRDVPVPSKYPNYDLGENENIGRT